MRSNHVCCDSRSRHLQPRRLARAAMSQQSILTKPLDACAPTPPKAAQTPVNPRRSAAHGFRAASTNPEFLAGRILRFGTAISNFNSRNAVSKC